MSEILKETHTGELLGVLKCGVLSNRVRVITARTMTSAFGSADRHRIRGGKVGQKQAEKTGKANASKALAVVENFTPVFLNSTAVAAHVDDELRAALASPLRYIPKHGGPMAHGFPAVLLPRVCQAIRRAGRAGVLRKNQMGMLNRADILTDAFAEVGIIALIDEATGYEKERPRDELNALLERYIDEKLRPWTKRFPDSFFRAVFKFYGWPWDPTDTARPQCVGWFIKRYVYGALPPGVLEKLQQCNETRSVKHHQWLTDNEGVPDLLGAIGAVTGMLRASHGNKDRFEMMFYEAYPHAAVAHHGEPWGFGAEADPSQINLFDV